MSNDTDLWMPFYIGDYLADTMHLDAEEHGAYILIMLHYWKNGGRIPNDANRLQQIARVKPSRDSKRIMSTVLQFFEIKEGFLYHKRIESEMQKAAENSENNKKRTAAATAAAAEKRNKKTPSTDNVTGIVTDSVTLTPSPSPSSITVVDDCYAQARPPENQKAEVKKIFEWIEKFFNAPGVFYKTSPISAWLDWGADFELDIQPTAERYMAKNPGNPPRSLTWLDEEITKSIKQRKKPMPDIPDPPPRQPAVGGYVNEAAKKHEEINAAFQAKLKEMGLIENEES